ncbi:MAG: alpha/beta hydrolase [Proteobacteria bacterium]|nr:alpha/beta hydrolase [Pseudomonadota bacterium]MBI3497805.1 alpha/beta hydrolase [Pseudomonadota bacterium]
MTGPLLKRVRTDALEIAFEESGPGDGAPVILLHGFPDDPRTWDGIATPLAAAGYRVFVPYLRGYGPTRFLHARTPRSGQQAALGDDLRAFMDGLRLERATLVGYDWGGRAACIVAALWPERVRALVSITGYNIQNIALSGAPADPREEHRLWYYWYFQTERGHAGLEANRRQLCRLLFELWSPNLSLDDAGYERTAASFDNPDFVEVVIHSYRHRVGNAPGDPALEAIERSLAAQPPITVPTIVLHGAADGVTPPEGSEADARHFSGPYQRRVVPAAGHFFPREAPEAVVEAVLELTGTASNPAT